MSRSVLTLQRPLVLLPTIAVAVVVLAGSVALLLVQAPEAAAGPASFVAPAAPLPDARPAEGRDRTCNACGTVETIRRTDSATGAAAYEFTVRMRDGSMRDSIAATRGRWLEGDRMMLIGGPAARALEEETNETP